MNQNIQINLINTPGFADPMKTQIQLWHKVLIDLQADPQNAAAYRGVDLRRDGISTVIYPIMVPTSKRVGLDQIKTLYETLMLFSMITPQFVEDIWNRKYPTILVVLNDFEEGDPCEDDYISFD